MKAMSDKNHQALKSLWHKNYTWLQNSQQQIITIRTELIKPHSDYRNVKKNKELQDINFCYQGKSGMGIQVMWLEMCWNHIR